MLVIHQQSLVTLLQCKHIIISKLEGTHKWQRTTQQAHQQDFFPFINSHPVKNFKAQTLVNTKNHCFQVAHTKRLMSEWRTHLVGKQTTVGATYTLIINSPPPFISTRHQIYHGVKLDYPMSCNVILKYTGHNIVYGLGEFTGFLSELSLYRSDQPIAQDTIFDK